MSESEPFAPFIARRLWPADATRSSGWRRRVRGLLRIGFAVSRDIAEGRLSLHAAGLVYTTILSLVPLIALSFSVLKGFGVHYRFEPLLLSMLAPLGEEGPVIAEQLMEFVDKMEVGVLGALGLAVLFYTAISMVQKVEVAFGDIWHVDEARSLGRKFTDYLSVLLIGPVLMFSAFGLGTSLIGSETVQKLYMYQPLALLIETATQLLPFALVVATFTFLYQFIPYTYVRFRSALIGGVVAGLVWLVAGWIFTLFVQGASSYTAIYSAFAGLVLFFIWLNVNWLILLIGASIAFYDQHPEYMPLGLGRTILSNRARERLALAAMHAIGVAQYEGKPALTTEALREHLPVPQESLHRMLEALRAAGLLAATADDPARWVPTRPYDTTDLKVLLDAARSAGERLGLDCALITVVPPVAAVEARIEQALSHALANWRLKDLVAGHDLTRDAEVAADGTPSVTLSESGLPQA